MEPLSIVVGPIDFAAGLALQERLAGAVERGEHAGALLLVEHPATVTLGRRAGAADLRVGEAELTARGVEIFRIRRGGAATWHAPGQLVGYPIVRLGAQGRAVRRFVAGIERALSLTAAAFGVSAVSRPDMPGLWAGERKLASIGIEVRRAVVRHGFALNVDMDLAGFSSIVSCGSPELRMSDLRTVAGRRIDWQEAASAMIAAWRSTFGWPSAAAEEREWTSIP